MKTFIFCVTAIFSLELFSANIVYNGSFELDTAGFAIERNLDSGKNPDLKFEPLVTVPEKSGKALLIRNANGDKFALFSKEFRLKNNTKYKISADVKGTRNGQKLQLLVFKVGPDWSASGTNVSLKTEWETATYSFTTTKGDGWYHFNLRTGDRSANKNNDSTRIGDFYIDNLRLEEVSDTSEDLPEISLDSSEKLYYKGDTAKISLKAYNPGKTVLKKDVVAIVRDEYFGKDLYRENVALSVEAGKTEEIELKKIELPRFGGYRITADAKGVKTHDGFFSVIGKYTAKPVDITKDFVVAFNGGLDADNLPAEKKGIHYTLYNSPHESKFELLSKLGCRIMRDHDGGLRGVDWASVQRSKDKFDFSHLDRQMKLYAKNNIILFPVIGQAHAVKFRHWQNLTFPEWVKYTRVTKDPPNCMQSLHGRIVKVDDQEYYDYIYETVKHLKGKVPVYEVLNEPNLYLSPEHYIHTLKLANQAIRKADPEAKISAFCLTSDFGAAATPWMKQCVLLQGLQYADAIGFHPYRGRTLNAFRPADRYIAELREEMKSYGRPDIPLWNTELYYLIDQDVKHNSYEESLCRPHHCVWRFLVDLAEGVVQSIAIPEQYIWKKMLTPNMLTGKNFHELIPSELFVAYNTMARLFEGAKIEHKFRFPSGVICYVFRKDGKLIAAVWNYQDRKLRADLTPFQVMDIFGNAEKSGMKSLKEAPYYLTQGKLSEKEFVDACRNLKIILDQPLAVGEYVRIAGDTLYATLHSESDEVIKGKIGFSNKSISAKEAVDFEISAQGKIILAIPVKIADRNIKSFDLLVVTDKNSAAFPVKAVFNKLIDGTIDMPNMKGHISFGNGKISLRGKVFDATNAGVTGKRNWWMTDCVELFFDLAPFDISRNHAQAYSKKVFRLFITPRDEEKLHTMGNIAKKDCKLSVTTEKDGYSFDLEINAETGNAIGFDLKIDDAPGLSGKVKEFQLGNGEKVYARRCNFCIAK